MTSAGSHVFVVDVEDEPGVLTRVSSLFRRRGFNIVSLTVGVTERARRVAHDDRRRRRRTWRPAASRRTCGSSSTSSASRTSPARPPVRRELAMVKVAADAEARTHVMQLADVFRARVVDVAPDRSSSRSPARATRSTACSTFSGRSACSKSRGAARRDGPRRPGAVRREQPTSTRPAPDNVTLFGVADWAQAWSERVSRTASSCRAHKPELAQP